jgi:hypothetical protein
MNMSPPSEMIAAVLEIVRAHPVASLAASFVMGAGFMLALLVLPWEAEDRPPEIDGAALERAIRAGL